MLWRLQDRQKAIRLLQTYTSIFLSFVLAGKSQLQQVLGLLEPGTMLPARRGKLGYHDHIFDDAQHYKTNHQITLLLHYGLSRFEIKGSFIFTLFDNIVLNSLFNQAIKR